MITFDAQGQVVPARPAVAAGSASSTPEAWDAFGWEQFDDMMQAEGLVPEEDQALRGGEGADEEVSCGAGLMLLGVMLRVWR